MQKPLPLQKLLANVAVQNYSNFIFNEKYKLVLLNFKIKNLFCYICNYVIAYLSTYILYIRNKIKENKSVMNKHVIKQI